MSNLLQLAGFLLCVGVFVRPVFALNVNRLIKLSLLASIQGSGVKSGMMRVSVPYFYTQSYVRFGDEITPNVIVLLNGDLGSHYNIAHVCLQNAVCKIVFRSLFECDGLQRNNYFFNDRRYPPVISKFNLRVSRPGPVVTLFDTPNLPLDPSSFGIHEGVDTFLSSLSSSFGGSGNSYRDKQTLSHISGLSTHNPELENEDTKLQKSDGSESSREPSDPIWRRWITWMCSTLIAVATSWWGCCNYRRRRVLSGCVIGLSILIYAAADLLFFLDAFRWSWGWPW